MHLNFTPKAFIIIRVASCRLVNLLANVKIHNIEVYGISDFVELFLILDYTEVNVYVIFLSYRNYYKTIS